MIDIIRRFPDARVAVIGDLIADEYVYGRVARVSREAPVLILEYDSTEVVPGGAGNAATNAAALGASVRLVGLVGRDEIGRLPSECGPEVLAVIRDGRRVWAEDPSADRLRSGDLLVVLDSVPPVA